MNDLGFLSIREAKEKISNQALTPTELFKGCLENLKESTEFNAYTEYTEEFTPKNTNEALSDIPAAIKDVFSTKDFTTTACSKILSNYKPPFDAISIKRIRKKDAKIIGKTNTDEFTCGAATETSCFGPTKNPYDKSRVAGGSSGGSAAAVALGTALFALGTDTGGSIRQPASFCNIVGLKVTYGRIPRSGVISMASSFDTIGPMARTVEDTATILNALAGPSPFDSTTPKKDCTDYTKNLNSSIKGKIIGVPKEYFGEGIEEDTSNLVLQSLKELEKKGAILKEISLPHTKYGVAIYYVLCPAEVSANMARYDGLRFGDIDENSPNLVESYFETRGKLFGNEMKRRILIGTYVLSAGYYDAYYRKAQKVRTLVLEDFKEAFSSVDVICGPVSPFSAFKIGEITDDPLANYKADLLTIPASSAGLPAISVPCGFDSKNMPVGLQIIGPQFEEERILNFANIYEKETQFYKIRPKI